MLMFTEYDEHVDDSLRGVVTIGGVIVRLPQPIGICAEVPWGLLPATLAGMKILATGATDHAATAIGLMHLTDDQLCAFERALGRINILENGNTNIVEHDSDLLDQVEHLLRWGAGLARHCPLESAARDLAMIDRLNDVQLSRVMLAAMR